MPSSTWSIKGLKLAGEVGAAECEMDEEAVVSSDVGHVFGTVIPAVLKNSAGEAKESNAPPGSRNNLPFKKRNFAAFHTSSSKVGDEDAGGGGEGDVAMEVQSYTPSLEMRPAMRVGRFLEAKDSVSARLVASVPPR